MMAPPERLACAAGPPFCPVSERSTPFAPRSQKSPVKGVTVQAHPTETSTTKQGCRRSDRQTDSRSELQEGLGRAGEVAAAGGLDQDHVLDAHGAAPRVVEAGLDRDHLPRPELVVDAADAGRLMDVEADAVAGAVKEAL